MGQDSLVIFYSLIFVPIILFLAYFFWKRKVTNKIAEKLGLTPLNKKELLRNIDRSKFPFLAERKIIDANIHRIYRGNFDGYEVYIFHRYITKLDAATVVYVKSDSFSLPRMQFGREGFSTGDGETKAETLLKPEVISILNKYDLFLESNRNEIIIYEFDKVQYSGSGGISAKPEEYRLYIDRALEVLKLLNEDNTEVSPQLDSFEELSTNKSEKCAKETRQMNIFYIGIVPVIILLSVEYMKDPDGALDWYDLMLYSGVFIVSVIVVKCIISLKNRKN